MKIARAPSRILLLRSLLLLLGLATIAGCKVADEDKTDDHDWTGAQAPSSGAAPVIWGEPGTHVTVNSQYLFQPEASDADGDVLEFRIVNKPAWSDFDSASGALRGMPGSDDVGTTGGIVISVTDSDSIVSLPSFSLTVDSEPPADDGGADGGGVGSSPPTIAGQPNETAIVGAVYAFQPEASDPEGDALSFSIVNKPSWATFDPLTGRLEGTPAANDVGQSALIRLSVTDGGSVAALTPFTITVNAVGTASYTLSWIPPTQNEDGTPLTDLAGYRIYYGTASGNYSETIKLDSAGQTTYDLGNLGQGTYYLAMTSVTGSGVESRYSAELEFDTAN